MQLKSFDKNGCPMFEFRKVDKDDSVLLREVYELRYKVYIEEWGFEKPEEHPGSVESDRFDENSVHFVALRSDNGQLIGTIRIILISEHGFPIESHSVIDADLSHIDRGKIGEISRLAVSKEYRRRATDSAIYGSAEFDEGNLQQIVDERRKNENLIVAGLYKSVYRESRALGLEYFYAVMSKGLYLLLKRLGIRFEPVGPAIDYHGWRTPYVGNIEQMLRGLESCSPELYQDFMGGDDRN